MKQHNYLFLLFLLVCTGILSFQFTKAFFTSAASNTNNTFIAATLFPTQIPTVTTTPTMTPTASPTPSDTPTPIPTDTPTGTPTPG